MNGEVKKVLEQAKKTQAKLQTILKNQSWVEDARKYAEKQRKEMRKLLVTDLGRVKSFLEKERTDLARLQRQLPGEVKKLRSFVTGQRKELEKLLKNLRRATQVGNLKGLKKKKKAPAKKRKKSDGSSASASGHTSSHSA